MEAVPREWRGGGEEPGISKVLLAGAWREVQICRKRVSGFGHTDLKCLRLIQLSCGQLYVKIWGSIEDPGLEIQTWESALAVGS